MAWTYVQENAKSETYTKRLALLYVFDLLRIFLRYFENNSTILCSKSLQKGCCGTLILARVQERVSPVKLLYSGLDHGAGHPSSCWLREKNLTN